MFHYTYSFFFQSFDIYGTTNQNLNYPRRDKDILTNHSPIKQSSLQSKNINNNISINQFSPLAVEILADSKRIY